MFNNGTSRIQFATRSICAAAVASAILVVSAAEPAQTLPEKPAVNSNSPLDPATAPQTPSQKAEKVAPQERVAPVKAGDSDVRLKFNFRFQPWGDVIEWFAEQAGLSLVLDAPPPGTFNYTDSRSYTPAEAIDLLNSVLLTKGYTLVRRERMLMLVNLEDGIPPNLVPIIRPEDLDKKGEFELVSMLLRLERLLPEEAQAEIKGLLGPQGSVVVLTKSGQIQVTETAGRLRMIRSVIEAAEHPAGITPTALRVFEVRHALLSDVLGTLRQLLDIPADSFASSDGSIRLAVDLGSGKLLVTGKAEKVARVEEILKAIDMPLAGGAEGTAALETPQLEVYSIATADPASVLQVMQTLLANSPDVRLAIDPKTGHLIALARPSQHATIRATLDQIERDARQIEAIRLQSVDPQAAALAINRLFGAETEGSAGHAPRVEVDVTGRQLLVHASGAQISQIRSLLEKMGESSTTSGASVTTGGTVRMLPYSSRQTRTALEQLEELWPTVRSNKIRIVAPRPAAPVMPPSGPTPPKTPPPAEPAEPPVKPPEKEPSATRESRGVPAMFVKAPAVEKPQPRADGQEAPPIIVVPGPGGLTIASEDIEALNEFEKLLGNLVRRNETNGPQFTIFYVYNADVAVVAETLQQILGGAVVGELTGVATGIVGGGLTVAPTRIIPDARLNALIVEASPAVLDTIEDLLKVLDLQDVPQTQVSPRPRLIAVVNTSAAQIAEIVREVYQDKLITTNRQRQPSPEELMQMMRGGRPSTSSTPRRDGQKMTVGVDTRTNSLIVAAPQSLFEEVQQLVTTLDQATSDSNMTVRSVKLKRGNALTVQKALTAIVGEKVRAETSGSTQGSSRSTGYSPDQQLQDLMRPRIDFFNGMNRGGFGSGGFGPPGSGGGPSEAPSGGSSSSRSRSR